MRRTLPDLADARKELLEIQQEFARLHKRIEAVRDCVTASLSRIFGSESPALATLAEEELIERVAGRVVAQFGSTPKGQTSVENRYLSDKEAARFTGISIHTLQTWRSKSPRPVPPVTRIVKKVLYSVRKLERYMGERTIGTSFR